MMSETHFYLFDKDLTDLTGPLKLLSVWSMAADIVYYIYPLLYFGQKGRI